MTNATSSYFRRKRDEIERRRNRPIQTPQAPQPQPSIKPLNNPQPQPAVLQQSANTAPSQAPSYNYNNYNYPGNNTTQTKQGVSLPKLGFVMSLFGILGYWFYTKSSSFAIQMNSIFGRVEEVSTIQFEPQLAFLVVIGLGVIVLIYGLVQRKQ